MRTRSRTRVGAESPRRALGGGASGPYQGSVARRLPPHAVPLPVLARERSRAVRVAEEHGAHRHRLCMELREQPGLVGGATPAIPPQKSSSSWSGRAPPVLARMGGPGSGPGPGQAVALGCGGGGGAAAIVSNRGGGAILKTAGVGGRIGGRACSMQRTSAAPSGTRAAPRPSGTQAGRAAPQARRPKRGASSAAPEARRPERGAPSAARKRGDPPAPQGGRAGAPSGAREVVSAARAMR